MKLSWIFLGMFLFGAVVGQNLYAQYNSKPNFDIHEYVESQLDVSLNYTNLSSNTATVNLNPNNVITNDKGVMINGYALDRMSNIANKYIDYIVYSFVEVSKMGYEFGYTHPELDFKTFTQWLVGILLVWLFFSALEPILLFGGLIYYAVIGLHKFVKSNYVKFIKEGVNK